VPFPTTQERWQELQSLFSSPWLILASVFLPTLVLASFLVIFFVQICCTRKLSYCTALPPSLTSLFTAHTVLFGVYPMHFSGRGVIHIWIGLIPRKVFQVWWNRNFTKSHCIHTLSDGLIVLYIFMCIYLYILAFYTFQRLWYWAYWWSTTFLIVSGYFATDVKWFFSKVHELLKWNDVFSKTTNIYRRNLSSHRKHVGSCNYVAKGVFVSFWLKYFWTCNFKNPTSFFIPK